MRQQKAGMVTHAIQQNSSTDTPATGWANTIWRTKQLANVNTLWARQLSSWAPLRPKLNSWSDPSKVLQVDQHLIAPER